MKVRAMLSTGLLMLLSVAAFGQYQAKLSDAQLNAAGPSKMLFAAIVTTCGVADSLAKADISHDMPFLLLAGGIAPVAYMPADALVEQKFQFHYYEYGCSSPEEECLLGYNQRVFAYLTDRYGKQWLKAVRQDIVGLKEWKAKH